MGELPRAARIYISGVIVIAVLVLAYFTLRMEWDSETVIVLLFFAILAIFTESLRVSLPRGGHVSVTFAVIYATVLLFGAGMASWVEIAGFVFSKFITKDKSPWYKLLFNCGQYVICVAVVHYLYTLNGGVTGVIDPFHISPLIVSALGFFIINNFAVTLILALVSGRSLWGMWLTNIMWTLPNMLTLSLLGIMMAGIYNYAGYWGVSLFFVPLFLARYVFKSYMEVRRNYFDTLGALASALDAKDKYTRGHSERVSEYATLIARSMKLPEDKVETIQHMALLHDVGKIGISDFILCKPDRLTNEEFETVKQHSIIGAKIIASIQGLGESKELILYHHERYAGGGYPTGKRGDGLPLGARIITVADAFDAMTSDRSYRSKRNFDEAIEVLQEMAGDQFDPEVVRVFVDVIRKEQNENLHYSSVLPVSE